LLKIIGILQSGCLIGGPWVLIVYFTTWLWAGGAPGVVKISEYLVIKSNTFTFSADDNIEKSKLISGMHGLLFYVFRLSCSTNRMFSLRMSCPSFIPLYTLTGLWLVFITCSITLLSGDTVARDRATHKYFGRLPMASDGSIRPSLIHVDISFHLAGYRLHCPPRDLLSGDHDNS